MEETKQRAMGCGATGVSRRGLLSGVLALTGAGLLAGCGAAAGSGSGAAAEGEGSLLEAIREQGTMTFATEGTWAPWTYHNENGELTGYDIEVARRLAEHLGVEAAFAEGEWDGLFAGLDSARYDAVANGVDVTPERAEKYAFTEPYAYNRTAIIVRADDDRIASFEDLDGMTTANTISSTYTQLAESYGATAQGVDDLTQTIDLLEAGRIDATLNAEVVYYDFLRQHPDAPLRLAAVSTDASRVAMPVRFGEETVELVTALNEGINALRDDGTLSALSEQFFGVDISAADGGAGAAQAAAEDAWSEGSAHITLTTADTTVTCELNDNPASRALVVQLPLELDIEPFGSNEKTFYPPEALPVDGAPLAQSGAAGTLAYYEPWGDVVLFYGSFNPNSSLFELGSIESSLEAVAGLSGRAQIALAR